VVNRSNDEAKDESAQQDTAATVITKSDSETAKPETKPVKSDTKKSDTKKPNESPSALGRQPLPSRCA
jgi:hypothetical protein